MNVCALVAAYDEAATIEAVVKGARRYVSEVVVVDDGSRDETASAARRAGALVLSHTENRGKGVAVRTGLAHILNRDFTHVLFMDADLQHDPEDIPLLLEKAATGRGEFVVGERKFTRQTMPPARFYANTIGSRIMSRIIGASIHDSQTGFRLVRSRLLGSIRLTARRYEIEAEILVKLARRGAVVESVAVPANYTGIRSKMRPFRDVFRICMLTMRYRYFSRNGDR